MADLATRVLVTGGAGFVGHHLVARLLEEGADVTVIDDFSRGHRAEEIERTDQLARVTAIDHDLTNPIDGLGLLYFDEVYHLAAVVGVAAATDDPFRNLSTNVGATMRVLEWCRDNPPARFFLSSTSEIADGAVAAGLAELPADEGAPFVLVDPTRPRSSYALSKIVSERLVATGLPNTRTRIGRYHNVYGPLMGYSHVIPELTQRVLDGADPLQIHGGANSRSFCYVADAVDATVMLTRSDAPSGTVANIGNDREETCIEDLARLILAGCGVVAELAIDDAPIGSPMRRLPDLGVLTTWTDYEPTIDLREGLEMTVRWYRDARRQSGRLVGSGARGRG